LTTSLQAAGGGVAGRHLPPRGSGENMKESDLPLVRGGKLPCDAFKWLEEVERFFPGATKDLILIRQNLSRLLRAEAE